MKERYNLQTDGVEMVSYTDKVRLTVNETAGRWRAFCELPDEKKWLFATSDTQHGTGYESKDGSGPRGDKKENFDYSVRGDVFSLALNTKSNKEAWQLIDTLKQLNQDIQDMIQDFGRHAGLPTDGAEAFIRCLKYPSGQITGGTVAEPHTDHSGFTFHLYETTSGCERLDFDGKWQLLPVADGETAVFGGMQSQLVTKGDVKAMCHRVVANEISAVAGRIAIVCFVSLPGLPVYNKAKFGRLQEMEPGFNYRMPYEEFRTLFK